MGYKDVKQLSEIQEKLRLALLEIDRLKYENDQLKYQLEKFAPEKIILPGVTHKIQPSEGVDIVEKDLKDEGKGVHRLSSVEEKIGLFWSYFRGRDDVYPVRWSNKQGKSGYSPACGNEWTPVCQKPKVKCSVCAHQNFLPITREARERWGIARS